MRGIYLTFSPLLFPSPFFPPCNAQHGKKSINDRPANLALVITDGEAVDGAEFEKALKAIPDEQWKKLYIVFALIGKDGVFAYSLRQGVSLFIYVCLPLCL